jgi:4-alpha-glucanotransferase
MRHAGSLRLDHVMSLHRLYWIPRELPAGEGVYVRYPAEELWAILALESHRHRTLLVGEDLGTVPDEVREAMDRHEAHHIYVQQYSYAPDPAAAIRPAPARSSASLNTHDMFPFAAFWEGHDIEERLDLGHMDEGQAEGERRGREAQRRALAEYLREEGRLTGEADARGALRGCLSHLAAGPARMVLLNLEDLWLEREPQNVPGTVQERPNWRRKARHPLEEIETLPEVGDALAEVDRLRRGRG